MKTSSRPVLLTLTQVRSRVGLAYPGATFSPVGGALRVTHKGKSVVVKDLSLTEQGVLDLVRDLR